MISHFVFNLTDYSLLTDSLVIKSIKFFFEKRVSNLLPNQFYYVGYVVYLEGSTVPKTIGPYTAINGECLKQYIDYILSQLALKNDTYKAHRVQRVVFTTFLKQGIVPRNMFNNLIPKFTSLSSLAIKTNKMGLNLPLTLILSEYPSTYFKDYGNGMITILNENLSFMVKSTVSNYLIKNIVEVVSKGRPLLQYVDTQLSKVRFKREVGEITYYYKLVDGAWILDFTIRNTNTKFMKKILPHKKLDGKIATIDIETIQVPTDGSIKLVPYLISLFDGVEYKSFYVTDFNNTNEMLKTAIQSLFYKKYDKYSIYCHNFSRFDGVFLLNTLAEFGNGTIIENNGRIISYKLTVPCIDAPNKFTTLTFLDSIHMLPFKLDDLGKCFNPNNESKFIFPIHFSCLSRLNYKGDVPPITYFLTNITQSEYLNYSASFVNNIFDFRVESIKYCEQDCKVLYDVLEEFRSMIWDNYQINITKTPTITSLAFAIFRSKFMKEENIARIKNSYTGGSCDMYIPTNILPAQSPVDNESQLFPEKILSSYDVNSLYPHIMSTKPVPTGKFTFFEGEGALQLPRFKDKLGFYLCEVTAPLNLKHPIIQIQKKVNGAINTISPTGTFLAYLYSEEIDNARKYGYKFKIINGYVFSGKENIFKEYVDHFYKQRLTFPKGSPMNLVSKLLLNSLYGRFGLKTDFPIVNLHSKEQGEKYLDKHNQDTDPTIVGQTVLENGDLIIKTSQEKLNDSIDSLAGKNNANVAIAAAITANARIFMSRFKNVDGLRVYYTDSDSIYCNKSPEEMNVLFPGIIGSNLGQFKLEHVVEKAVFLAPKCYLLKTIDGEFILKIKGLNSEVAKSYLGSDLSMGNFFNLLIKDSATSVQQLKWFRKANAGAIFALILTN